MALANAKISLQSAYKNFFSKKGVGFPKYKRREKSRKQYKTNNQHGSIRIENGKIKLMKVGYVKIVPHRPSVDYLHKKSYNLAEEYVIETLNMRTMGRLLRFGNQYLIIVSASYVKCCNINCIVVERD